MRGACILLTAFCGGCLGSSAPGQVFYGARYEVEGRGELISFAAEDPSEMRVLIEAQDDQYFGEPNWVPSADAFDVVRELDGSFTIERVTTEWVSVQTRVELGELRIANRDIQRVPGGEVLYLLTRDDERNHLSRVDADGVMSEVVDLALYGISAPQYCSLTVLDAQRVSINCLGSGGNAPMFTVVNPDTQSFDTYWTEMDGHVGHMAWAPDGSAFAFCVGDAEQGGDYVTWLVEVTEGAALASNEAVSLGPGCPQAWDPQSRRLATNYQVFDTDGEDPSVAEYVLRDHSNESARPGDPTLYRFAPDGSRLAYGEVSSHVMSFETLETYRYREYGGGYFEPPPVWSADGSHLYRGDCSITASDYDWRCSGDVFAVDDLLLGCPDDEGDWEVSRPPCGRIAPGSNAASAVPPLE